MKSSLKAVIFDLDGVITQTAKVHTKAWKKMFDAFLSEYARRQGQNTGTFSTEDYLRYVDGKPRYEGVQSFLQSRGIDLPYGTSGDLPGSDTVCGLGNRKNIIFNEILEDEGVEIYASSVRLMHELKTLNIRIALASSSKNAQKILEITQLDRLIEVRIDGVVSARRSLSGKPAPDIFLEAAKELHVSPCETVVIEDAASGVKAAKAGNFALVLGVARENNEEVLLENGADVVVNDLADFPVKRMQDWFEKDLPEDTYHLRYYGLEPGLEKTRETLLTVGNGYMGVRGALEETRADGLHYPATYIAGLYNKLTSVVGGKEVVNEDFVNIPNAFRFQLRLDGENFIPDTENTLSMHRKLDFRTGILSRESVHTARNKRFRILSERFVSMDNPHLAVAQYELEAFSEGFDVEILSSLDGDILNRGVERYRSLNSRHLEVVYRECQGNLLRMIVKTLTSGVEVDILIRHEWRLNGKRIDKDVECLSLQNEVAFSFSLKINKGDKLQLLKYISISDNRNFPHFRHDAAYKSGFGELCLEELALSNKKAREDIWKKTDIRIHGDRLSQRLLRLHIYHLFVAASLHNRQLDAGITARGLHGEAYRGHIFWDELFILPFYTFSFPEITKSLLLYRYRRLAEAQKNAAAAGYRGAMFPWQSGSRGSEETQSIHYNPVSDTWGPDYSSLQRHVSLAIAYNVYTYYEQTGDREFMQKYGIELFFEICKFWADIAEKNEDTGRYEVKHVMGPDEFHERNEKSDNRGLKDNAYTNILMAAIFYRAEKIAADFAPGYWQDFASRQQIAQWTEIARHINLVIEDGIIAQFDGYFDLQELDWEAYRKKYGNIHRLDRILKAEGKSPDDYKVAKQADTLMIFFLLTQEEVNRILRAADYHLPHDFVRRNFDYYLPRTSHGSTLSKIVHGKLAWELGKEKLSWELFTDALRSDFDDVQGGTTGEGIHSGVMASSLLHVISAFGGVRFDAPPVNNKGKLPDVWNYLKFNVLFRNKSYAVEIEKKKK